MTNIVIASAARTRGRQLQRRLRQHAGARPRRRGDPAVLERAGVAPEEVSETILGQVLTAGQGQNPARQAHINAGLPKESAAWGINQVCGSGLRAVALGAQHIALGDDAHRGRRRPGEHVAVARTPRTCAPGRRWAT